MNRNRMLVALAVLALSGCTQTAKVAAPPAAPLQTVTAPRQLLAPVSAPPAVDPATFAQAQANLRALGYGAGKGNDPADPAFQRALINFERDQGMTEDGQLTVAVLEKLRLMRAALRLTPATPPSGLFVYSGSGAHHALTLVSPPEGFVSDAPANFLLPLKAGSQALLHLTRKGAPPIAITCRAAKSGSSNLPLGTFETVAIDCRGDSAKDPQWHDLFSPRLGLVVQRQERTTRDLVAIRPVTSGWPLAVRTGLDWAISHALDEPAPTASLQWSSTAVAPHFDIKVTARMAGAEAGLGKAYAAAVCRRFELVQTGVKSSYPGIACQNAAGDWVLPGSGIGIARPAGLAKAASLRSAVE